jgi:hypothetical protein
VLELAQLGIDVDIESRYICKINKFSECSSILFGDFSFLDKISKSQFEGVLSVVLPYSSEMRFLTDLFWLLMWEDNIVFGDEFRNYFSHI